ncbi:MAG TPA: cytochrome c [Candidatus Binataceae bacterium]|nr:cytochrome c [Candidatus Binataceae bacterium]
MNRFLAATMVSALVMTLSGPVLAADMAAAKQNYDTFCVKCHGAAGKGDGPGAAALSTHPRDFTDCAAMAKISDDTLFNVIKNGGASAGLSPDMQAWSSGFEDGEIHDLVAYVRTFCKK